MLYFAGFKGYFHCVFILTIIDLITVKMAAMQSGEKFTPKILKKGIIEKFFLYNFILIAVMVLESVAKTVLNYDAFYFVLLAAFLISSYETVRIFENIIIINPNLKFIQPLINLTTSLQNKAVYKAEDAVVKVTDGIGN